MSRGVVLWPDRATSDTIRSIWDALAAAGLPSLATHTHRLHQPHCSLVVGEELPAEPTLKAVGIVPAAPIPFDLESVAIFPQLAMVLPCVPSLGLMEEQRRAYSAVHELVVGEWPWFGADRWSPHVTLAMSVTPDQAKQALPIVLERLPIRGVFDRGGVEDGTSGEHWPGISAGA